MCCFFRSQILVFTTFLWTKKTTSTPNCWPTRSPIPETFPGATATAASSYSDGLDVSLATTRLGTSRDWEKRGSSTSQCVDSQGENSRWMDGWNWVSKKSPTGPTERTPKPEYLITLATYLGVRWDSVPFNLWWIGSHDFFQGFSSWPFTWICFCVFLGGFFYRFGIPWDWFITIEITHHLRENMCVWTFSKHRVESQVHKNTPGSTNNSWLGNPPFEDVSPLKNGGAPLLC